MEIRLAQPKEAFPFSPVVNHGLEVKLLIVLTSLEVFNSVFKITEESNLFQLSEIPDLKGRALYENINSGVGKDLRTSDVSHTELQDEILSSFVLKNYQKAANVFTKAL